jgi:ABC-2 type transport system ATP-binding protein
VNPLHIEHLTKAYGSYVAVDDVSISLKAGTVYGLLGRNGAGKTTAIACILGLVRANAGDVRWFGQPLHPSLFERIAYVPEINCLDGWMTPVQHAEFRASAFKRFDRAFMKQMIGRFEINPSRPIRKMSKGQRQAVALALAFAQRADLMILDEPGSGLDPVMQRRLLDTIVSASADGVTTLFSSHHIGHVEQAAERIGIIDKAKLALEADIEELRERRSTIEAYFETVPDLTNLRSIISSPIQTDGGLVRVYANGDAVRVEEALRALRPITVARRPVSLEDVFLTTVGEAKEYSS